MSQVDVYTCFKKDDLYKTLFEIVGKYKKVVLLISFFTTQFFDVEEVIKNVRKDFDKKVICIAGGPHPTGSPLSTLNLGFDLAVLGEAEEVFLKLIDKMLKDEEYFSLPNIAHFDENKSLIINKRDEKFVDLDKFPPITKHFEHYGPIEITRGCPYRCNFCQTSQIFGTKLRNRSVEKVCEYIEIMFSKGLADTRFITPSLFLYGSKTGKDLNLSKIEELFKNVKDIIKSKGKLFVGTFPSEIRPEHINKDTIEILKKYADNDNVILGAQSGSERVLKLANRGHTLDDVCNAVELLTKANFKVNLDFIFGLPYETKDDVVKTIDFIDKLISKYRVRIHAHYFIPLPGTKFQDCLPEESSNLYLEYSKELKSKGVIYGNWEKQIQFLSILRKISKNYI
jgi:B12-binding domain/radical SAM domain protein